MKSSCRLSICVPFNELLGAGQPQCIGIHFRQEETLLESIHCGTARDFGRARPHSRADCGL